MTGDYHYRMCSITEETCDSCFCDDVKLQKKHEREEYEDDKITDFKIVTTFDKTVKINGIEVNVNRNNVIAKVNDEKLSELKSNDYPIVSIK